VRVKLAQPARAARNHLLAARIDDPIALARFLERLDAAERRLARFTALGRIGREPGTRELLIAGTPYLFVYRIEETAVVILDIRHSGRQPS
jgi:toxin ParE1/3/4